MEFVCKHCGKSDYRKSGFSKSKQRYCCKSCNKIFSEGDKRERYGIAQKLRVLKLCTDGVGIRTIERSEGISTPLIIRWIRNMGKLIKQHIVNSQIPDNAKDITILEMDELFTLYQKKDKEFVFGLVWTETGIKLLI